MVDVNTSIDGVIVSYANGLAVVKPLGNKQFQDGESLPFPNIHNVPVRWPSFNGGACGFKAPVKAGDKVLLVFSQQAYDNSSDLRRHDLSDAYAVPCGNSQTAGGSNNEDTIMYFGTASIRITPDGQIILKAPNGIVYDSPTLTVSNDGAATAMSINGTITNNGKNVGSTHTHTGVQTGGGTTGQVS